MKRSPRPKQVKCALLGLGHPHSGVLLATLQNLPEISGVSLWEETSGAAQASGISRANKVEFVSTDLDAVLGRAGVEFAIVCVRNDLAAAVSREVVAAGKHLLAEKPAGISATEIDRLKRAAERAGVHAAVLYIRRVHPVARAARQWVQEGKIGPLLSMEARFLATQVRFRDPRSWLFSQHQAGGGILSWLGSHYLDLFHYISGDEISNVAACTARRSGEDIDVEDSAALALKFRSGAVGTLHMGYTLAYAGAGYLNPTGNDGYFACNGRVGRVVWPHLKTARLHLEGPGRPPVRTRDFNTRTSNSYSGASGEDFLREFMLAMQDRGPMPATLDDALRTARVLEAAYRSASSGRMIDVAR